MMPTKNTTYIYCTLTFEGIHCWKNAPKEVAFLRDSHRHLFYVEATKQVSHNDRETEFIMLGREIASYIESNYSLYNGIENVLDMGQTSCEMLADLLLKKFDLFCCKVSEDNENGSIVYRG